MMAPTRGCRPPTGPRAPAGRCRAGRCCGPGPRDRGRPGAGHAGAAAAGRGGGCARVLLLHAAPP
jgi:hypothetical protein